MASDNDNLWQHPDTGLWYWRKLHPTSRKRMCKSTGQRQRNLARRVAQGFEDDLAKELAGVKKYDSWTIELEPLAKDWLDSLKNGDAPPLQRTLDQKEAEITRALVALRLRVAADLTHVATLDDRLRALAKEGVTRSTMRRSFQGPLKQFSAWLAENGRRLPNDPLACWKPVVIPREEQGSDRRDLKPLEAVRTLAALEVLDRENGRVGSARLLFRAMLVAAPRAEAMASRNVRHFDPKSGRIDLGAGRGKKNKGACALDPETAAELEAALKGRGPDEPLFMSPEGGRWPTFRMLDCWREAFSLATVDDLWPKDEPRSLDLTLTVSRSLLKGRVSTLGGNPHLPITTDEAKRRAEARAEHERRVARIVERLRTDWTDRLVGVDVHGLRMNLRTWAEAKGCPPVLIDKQLGHGGGRSQRSLEVYKAIAGSRVGRSHYLNLESELFDPSRAAVAVRELLDEAEAVLEGLESMLVLPRAAKGRTARA